jgi:hypothetical protein
MTEQNRARNLLFNNLTRVQHREYSPMVRELHTALEADPDFISRACVYLANGGTNIRDTADCAAITLLTSPTEYPEYREAGRCLFLGKDVYNIVGDAYGFEPFRIFRIDEFIRKYQVKSPRLMRESMTDYVRFLEGQPSRFDGVAIRNRKALKSVYTHYHIKPDARAQAIIFDDNPPVDSKLGVLKQIANSTDVREQVRLVVENKIPYVVASSVLPKMTPAVGVALIEVMSPTEALNSRGWIEKSGLLQVPEIRDAYTAKIAQATKSAASIEYRKSAQGSDAGIQEAVEKAKEESVSKQQRITQNVALLVDKSGSMEAALAVAIKFGERIAPICDGELAVIAFNDYAQELKVTDTHSLMAWQHAFKGIRCGGYTSMREGLELSLRNGYSPQIVVVITDEGENRGSYSDALKQMERNGLDIPHTVCLAIGARTVFSDSISNAGFRVDRFQVSGEDYYIFDQVAAILGGSSAPTIVERILSTQLPHRAQVLRA